jgi:hypothetical protein
MEKWSLIGRKTMNSEMDIRGYKPADETYYEYKDEEEVPRGVHHEKTHDEDIEKSTVGRYASGEDFKHWPFKVGNAMTHNTPDDVQHPVDTGGSAGYATMDEFMEEDSAKEQAWVDRENESVISLAINNWFGLKGYIMSFFPEKK